MKKAIPSHRFQAQSKAQSELDALDDGQLMGEQMTPKNAYYTYNSSASDIIARASQSRHLISEARNLQRTPESFSNSVDNEIALPKINLPIFAGTYEDWPGFADQFRSAVHENIRIDDCKKLMYLRSCLQSEAAQAIETLGNTAINYAVAWEILKKRYDQPAIIVTNHVKALFDMPQRKRAS